MPVDVTTWTDIARPRAAVAAFAADPDIAPRWHRNIDGPVGDPAAHRRRIQDRVRGPVPGRRLRYTYEVLDVLPGERLVMSTTEGPFPMETTYIWADVDGGTRMTLRNRGEPAGLMKLAAPAVAAAMRRANRKDLAQLKQLLEAGA